MPFGSVKLIPGVNTERTPTLLEASFAASQAIRFKDSLVQKQGGFQKFYANPVSGTPRDMHAWQDLNQVNHLAVGATTQLAIITSGTLNVVTPQTLTTNFTATGNFSFTANSTTVGITDANVTNVTILDAIYLNTPVYGAGVVLSGLYPITAITGVNAYQIQCALAAATTTTTAHTPIFTSSANSATVSVEIDAHGVAAGSTVVFPITTSLNGLSVQGSYAANTITDANDFTITANVQATAVGTTAMNAGRAQLVYYLNLGPPAGGSGFGLGGFGSGGFGTGATPASQSGTPITTTDYTSDNWGEILLACPINGGLYQFDPTAGFTNAALVRTAPIFNGGMFVSMAQQIVVLWGSTVTEAIGVAQDPLFIKWCTIGDFLSSSAWVPLTINQAGGYRIPTGSKIVAGMAAPNQNLIWTDLDCWAMTYQGPPFVYGFNKIGAGAGAVSTHAAQQLRGLVFWWGPNNFYVYSGGAVSVLPCPVWDSVFQNLNTAFTKNVRAMPNTPFNEVGWLFPSTASSSGECDSHIKFNITEPGAPWDINIGNSQLARSAWIDQTILGFPIGASSQGFIYQHETTNDADGSPLNWSWTTGYFEIGEGEDFFFVDQIIPDFKLGTYAASQGAQIQLTFNVVNYPTDTPLTYGPYLFNSSVEFLSVGFRGRQMSITASGSDLGSFNRLGRVRYRYRPDGRA
jgi:hypothetical protein